jgi:hypothetical protein
MRQDVPKKPDPLVLLARASAGKRRQRSRAGILIALALVVGVLAVLAWLSWPRAEPPPLLVIASDQLAPAGHSVTLRAWVRPEDPKMDDADLEGIDLYFADTLLEGVGGKAPGGLREKVATGADGRATVRWRPPAGQQPHFVFVRYPGDRQRGRAVDQARVYTWPADSRLLIVEVRSTLMDAAEARRLSRGKILNPRPVAGAAAALSRVRGKRYQIVYLAVAPDRPEEYRKLRGWLQERTATGQGVLPEGPVLGRDDYGSDSDAAAARRGILRDLKQQFKGKMVAVAGRQEDVEGFRAAGMPTFLVGGAAAPAAGVKRVKSWAELAEQLP